MNPWLILGAVLALAGAFVAGDLRGSHITRLEIEHGLQEERESARAAAEKTARDWREAFDARMRYDQARVVAIDARLVAATDELRKRPERSADLSADPRATCTGANGAELGGSHAIFLARLAARAARQDTALAGCYASLDALRVPASSSPDGP